MKGSCVMLDTAGDSELRRGEAESSPVIALSHRIAQVYTGRGSEIYDTVRSVGLGYDEGTVLIKIGREEPVASMDTSGKIIWARHNEIQTVNVKSLGQEFEEVGATSIRPHTVLLSFCLWPCHQQRWWGGAPPRS
jgi:hypothetical protein